MPRTSPLVASMNTGEISPNLWARLDFSKYPYSLKKAENVILMAEGAIRRRAGTRYIAEVKSSSVKGKLKRFKYSTTQAYIVELGNTVMRFFRYQGLISVANTDAAVTNGTFTSNITGWDNRSTGGGSIAHDATNGRLSLVPGGATSADIGWAEQAITTTATNTEHVLKFRVIGAPGDKIEFQVGTASVGAQTLAAVEKNVGYHCVAFTPTTSPFYIQFKNKGTNANKTLQIDDVSLIDNAGVEIDTPYAEADLHLIDGPQSADVLYLYHKSYPTYKLERYGHTTWSLVEVAWQDGPWLDENTTSTTLTFSAATGLGVTVTASSIVGINGGVGFKSTDVGRLIRMTDGTVNWGWAVIVGFTSTTVVTVDVKRTVVVITAETKWRLGAWSGTTGYPSCATFYEQRLWMANNGNQPQTLWASQTSDFENMAPDSANPSGGAWDGTVQDDDSLDYTLSSDDVNAVFWLSAGGDVLAIGTSGGIWIPASQGVTETPTDIAVRRQTSRPCSNDAPVRIDNFVLFIQGALRKLREFGYVFERDSYNAPDMTRLAEHITYGGLTEIVYAEEPYSLVWSIRDDGQAPTMTYRREEDVVGWARQIIGGSFYSTIAKVWQVDDSASTFVDETTDANSSTSADWTVFPASEAVGDYVAIGHTKPFTKVIFDYAGGTAGVGGAVSWEYWNGTAWTALSGVTDNTTGFTVAASDNLSVTWTEPTDWVARQLNAGKTLYYIRAKVTTVYTTNPILDQGFIPGDAVIESIDVIPGADGSGQTQSSENRDEVWMIVKRTINGATKRYVEMLERDFEDGHDQEDAYYADSLITYDGTATTSITGLGHLEGETVKVWADGYIHTDEVVTSGAITLDQAASVVQVGLPYAHLIQPVKVLGGTVSGTPLGKIKQIFDITFALHNCATIKYGPDEDNLQHVDFREVASNLSEAVELFTGELTYELDGDWSNDPSFVIKCDDPAPFTLLAWTPSIDVRELR